MKSFSGLAFFPAIFLLFSSPTQAAFSDLSNNHIYLESINYVQNKGIVSGFPDGTFGPELRINRAEFAKIVIGAKFGHDVTGENCFPDVKTEWFAKYVCQAKELGIINGYPDGSFGPGKNVSFVEAAKILANAFRYQVSQDEEIWFRPFVEALQEKSAIPLTILSFSYEITRGEMAEMIYRIIEQPEDTSSLGYAQLQGAEEYVKYQQWLVPRDVLMRHTEYFAEMKQFGATDCVALVNQDTGGGDLLSSLMVDFYLREQLKLDVFSREYVHDLETEIVNQLPSRFGDAFFAGSICHLGTGIEALSGFSTNAGRSTNLVAIRSGNKVNFYDDITILHQADGDEDRFPCDSSVETGKTIRWECYTGPQTNESGHIIGNKFKAWIFPVDLSTAPQIEEGFREFDSQIVPGSAG